MEKYSDAEIAKIIDKCEILILPENSSIEEVLGSENQLESNLNEKNLFSSIDVDAPEAKAEDTEEDFERIFQASKANKQQVSVSEFLGGAMMFLNVLIMINFASESHCSLLLL